MSLPLNQPQTLDHNKNPGNSRTRETSCRIVSGISTTQYPDCLRGGRLPSGGWCSGLGMEACHTAVFELCKRSLAMFWFTATTACSKLFNFFNFYNLFGDTFLWLMVSLLILRIYVFYTGEMLLPKFVFLTVKKTRALENIKSWKTHKVLRKIEIRIWYMPGIHFNILKMLSMSMLIHRWAQNKRSQEALQITTSSINRYVG